MKEEQQSRVESPRQREEMDVPTLGGDRGPTDRSWTEKRWGANGQWSLPSSQLVRPNPPASWERQKRKGFFWEGGHQTKHKKQHCLFCSEIESLINLKIKETSRRQSNFMLDTMDLLGSLDAPTLKVLDFGLDRPEWVARGLAQVLGEGGCVWHGADTNLFLQVCAPCNWNSTCF